MNEKNKILLNLQQELGEIVKNYEEKYDESWSEFMKEDQDKNFDVGLITGLRYAISVIKRL